MDTDDKQLDTGKGKNPAGAGGFPESRNVPELPSVVVPFPF
jgi:hypothetical protein